MTAPAGEKRSGRNVIAVIGIDRYRHESWRSLDNAVADARGTAAAFAQLGFEQVATLFDDEATGEAIEGLVTDDLVRKLGPDDNLVLFYAGHGSTRSHQLGGQVVKTGYLVPSNASDRTATWIELDGWLRAVSLLPPKHILVILDACHSGIALGQVHKWRDGGAQQLPLSALRARQSRRIITSSLDNEVALDSGPLRGHSLFTGCLIEALTHGVRPGSRVITGSELWLHLRERVETYPRSRQTPDFGAFDNDERGEMVIPLAGAPDDSGPPPRREEPTPPEPLGPPRRRVALLGAAGAALALLVALLASRIFDREGAPRSLGVVPSASAAPGAEADAEDSQAEVARGGCPAGMVRVPGGTFRMGSPDGEGDESEHPQHEVTLSAYCIDRMEVTVREYRACVAADGCVATASKLRLEVGSRPEVVVMRCNGADRPDHPMHCVGWEQAVAYCKWAKKRLPTEAEWEYAARGGDGRKYPWGDPPPNVRRVNGCDRDCELMAERDLKLEWIGMYSDSDGWSMTAPVGRYPAGAGASGALDMAGNVAEWTADSYRRYAPEPATNPRISEEGDSRVIRGGSWRDAAYSSLRAVSRDAMPPGQGSLTVGFRCARDAVDRGAP